MTAKELNFISSVFEIVTIFGEIEVGSTEIDLNAVLDYINSPRVINDFWFLDTIEKMQQYLTDQILDGLRIWEFLRISDWTKNMLERNFAEMCEKHNAELERKYVCFRNCQFYDQRETAFGTLQRCTNRVRLNGRDFEPQKKCKYYAMKG